MLAIAPESLAQFQAFCERERCPFAVVGVATEERQLVLADAGQRVARSTCPWTCCWASRPRCTATSRPCARTFKPLDLSGVELQKAVIDVLSHPTVASKRFLITIGDRTVGGLTHRDQMVGPWQVPVADCAVTLADYAGFAGEAMSMGERTPLAVLDAPASGRMAVAEAITNLLAAPIELSRVKLSANWMAACGEPGEDAALYATVQAVGMELCPALGISIPVGKDSLSMRTQWRDGECKPEGDLAGVPDRHAPSPRLADVRGTLTPQLNATQDTTLLLVDLGKGQQPHGRQHPGADAGPGGRRGAGSGRSAGPGEAGRRPSTPCARRARCWPTTTAATAACSRRPGEMAFAGHVGVALNVDMLVTEGDGITDSRMDYGDAKNWAARSAPRRDELTLKALFSEELGVVLQVRTDARNDVMQVLREHGLTKHSHVIGKTRPASPPSKSAWARCRSGATPRRCSAPSWPTCTRSGTA